MNENEMFMPKPTIQKTEAVEKNTLKSSESDSDLSWDSKSIDTFDDLRKKPIPGISTFITPLTGQTV